jgi:hypothetical protein
MFSAAHPSPSDTSMIPNGPKTGHPIFASKAAALVLVFLVAAAGCGDPEGSSSADGSIPDATALDSSSDVTLEAGTDSAVMDSAPGDSRTPDTGGVACSPTTSTSRLVSMGVADPPVLDGLADDVAWRCASVLRITLDTSSVYTPEGAPAPPAYPGLTKTEVTLRSVYTTTDVYFIASWADPTRSLARLPWEKQPDGTWKQLSNLDSSGHDNTYYEDKLAMQWNIKSSTFAAVGCLASCHASVSNAMPAQKYNKPGELTDLWHWKSVRTEPNGQIDDGYVGDPTSGKCEGLNCRLADAKTAGGYKDNNKAGFMAACPGDPGSTGRLPCFMGPPGAEIVKDGNYWIFDDKKQPFVDSFVPGDRIAGIITASFVGSRGDVTTKARYADGTWTIEIRRALTTAAGEAEDVQFSDLTKVYEFGVAVFDNSQINHASHETVLKLTFNP